MTPRVPLVLAVATGLLMAGLGSPAHAASGGGIAGGGGSGLKQEKARSAPAFVDSIGVGVHLAYEDTPYADAERVAGALADLGIAHVRDDLFLDDPEQYAAISTVAAGGVRFDLISGRPGNGRLPGEYVAAAAALGPAVESLEGPNEWDISGRPGWAAELLAWQSALYLATKLSWSTRKLPVLSPALAFVANASALGSLPGVADVANLHLYTGGQAPSYGVDTVVPQLQAALGLTPVMVTETGYHNAVASSTTHPPVPEDVAAVYEPRILLENYARGIQRTYLYELLDEFPDPARTNPEADFGLLRHDWSPKPAYDAIRNLIDLAETPGGSATNGALGYELSGAPADVRKLLVKRRDGAFVLFLWRDVSVYDTATATRLDVPAVPVTVKLAPATPYAVQRPSTSAAPVAAGTASSVTEPLDGQVTAVVLKP